MQPMFVNGTCPVKPWKKWFLSFGKPWNWSLRVLESPGKKHFNVCTNPGRLVELFQRYSDFPFSRWRPSAILDLFYACWDHPRRVFGGLYDCAKFGCNRRSKFDSMQILIFCTLSSKMPIYAPKIVLLGFYPKMGSSMNETPKRHILGLKHVVLCIDHQNRSTSEHSARAEELKQ